MALRIQAVAPGADLAAVAELFSMYAASLPIDLGYQDFAAELAGLPGKYAPPAGALFLARGAADAAGAVGAVLGCVALRPADGEGRCEMKRLFVRPEARGLGLGRALAGAVIDAARRIGHREMVLDSLRSMSAAQRLYREIGFVEVAPYYAPAPEGIVFMGLGLEEIV